jgi:dihydrofolate reductase
MGALVLTENISVDGVIENVDNWFQPAGDDAGVDRSDMEEVIRQHAANQAALLLGRKTFEAFRGYWPKQTDDNTGITDHLNRVPKYVVSKTLDDPRWANTTILSADAVEETRDLVARTDGEIGVTGSITLVHALLKARLFDEYRLFSHPVVVGHGQRLFSKAFRHDLELVQMKRFRCEVVLVTYRPTDR